MNRTNSKFSVKKSCARCTFSGACVSTAVLHRAYPADRRNAVSDAPADFACRLRMRRPGGRGCGLYRPAAAHGDVRHAAFYVAIAMAFELLTYGLVSGIMYRKVFKKQTVGTLYGSLLIAMVAGRIVWGIVKVILSGIAADAGAFTFAAFISGALLNAIPGIVVQLILVPAVVVALQKAKLIEAPSAEKA